MIARQAGQTQGSSGSASVKLTHTDLLGCSPVLMSRYSAKKSSDTLPTTSSCHALSSTLDSNGVRPVLLANARRLGLACRRQRSSRLHPGFTEDGPATEVSSLRSSARRLGLCRRLTGRWNGQLGPFHILNRGRVVPALLQTRFRRRSSLRTCAGDGDLGGFSGWHWTVLLLGTSRSSA